MSTYTLVPGADPQVPAGPKAVVLWTLALLGVAAGVSSVVFAVTNDTIGAELGAPLVIAVLWAWTTVAYILCGMFAWWRRPASRIGPLMIASGFVCYIVTLSWTKSDIPYTTGQAFDKLPWVAFLLVFLAFPNGRLTGRFERILVVTAFVIALGLELVRMVIGDYGPNNLLGFAAHPNLFVGVRRFQLIALSRLLSHRRRHTPHPPVEDGLAIEASQRSLDRRFCVRPRDGGVLWRAECVEQRSTRRGALGGVRDARDRTDRLSDRAPRRSPRALGGRRSDRRAAGGSVAGRPARRARARACAIRRCRSSTGFPSSGPTRISTARRSSCRTSRRRDGDDADRPERRARGRADARPVARGRA